MNGTIYTVNLNLEQASRAFDSLFVGTKVDLDNFPKGNEFQCVDLVKKWGMFLGRPITTVGNAINFATKLLGPNWSNRIENTKDYVPPEGAIVIFKATKSNEYGHIAKVGKGSNKMNLVITEQNGQRGFGFGTNGDEIRTRTVFFYSGVECFFLPK